MKRIIYISLSILLFIVIILNFNSTPENKVLINKDNIDNKKIAIYLEQENGKYNKTTTFPTKEDNYILNTRKSVCNGNTNLLWDNESWGLKLSNIDREEISCYLYFDQKKTISEIITTLNAKTEQPDFSQVATTDEGVFAAEDGMYGGTSYYWRGAATTNHVIFANKCWRIVRINGDQTMRLIYNGFIKSENTCTGNEKYSGSIAQENQAYNTLYDRAEYVGWTYNIGSQRPADNGTATASNAKKQTDTWYNANIGNNTTYASKVADGKYCNDRDTASGYTWKSKPTSKFSYAARGRLDKSKEPTLSCPLGDIYTMKAGAITADEAAYAGGNTNITNDVYFLNNGQNYWTITPATISSTGTDTGSIFTSNQFIIIGTGTIAYYYTIETIYNIRPVINLRSDVTFNPESDGTPNNPYIVLY